MKTWHTYVPWWCIAIGLCLLAASFAMAAVPPVTNFAFSTVSTGYDSTATSIALSTGGGAKFPATFPYPVVWWQCTDYAPHTDPNVEIVSVTNRVSDTLTVTRAQEGTSAVNHNTGGKTYCIGQMLTKGMWDAMVTEIGTASGAITDVVDAQSYASFNAAITAIGSAVKTLRLSNDQAVSANVTIHANTTIWCIGSGKLSIATGVTVSADRPEQFRCDRRQIFALTGTGVIAFAKPGTIYPAWWGAVADGSSDDGPEIQAAHDSLPSTGGTIDFAGGTYKSNQEIASAKNNVIFRLGPATLDLTNIAGTGTSNIHDTDAVLAGFKLTGAGQRVVGGRITGVPTVSSKRVLGVLMSAATNARVGGTQIDGLFACVWIANNSINPLLQSIDCQGNSHGVQLGAWHTSASSPQVTRAALLNVYSHGATVGSGLKCGSYAFETQVIAGEYASNAGHGIDLYPGCQKTTVANVYAHNNTKSGLFNTYNSLTGTSAGKLGVSSGLTIDGGQYDTNSESNVAVYLTDYSLFSSVGGVEDVVVKGVQSYSSLANCFRLGVVRSTVRGNIAKSCTLDGFAIYSTQDTSIQGNQSWDHGTGGDNRTGYLFTTSPTTGSTPPDNTRFDFSGNHGGDTRAGGSRTVNFAVNLANVSNSHVAQNIMQNANTNDWTNVTGHTGLYLAQNSGTGSIGASYTRHLSGSATWDPASLGTNAETSTTITVTGAAVGDRVICGHTQITGDLLQLTAVVSAANTVRAVLENISAGTVDVSSGTLACEVWQ